MTTLARYYLRRVVPPFLIALAVVLLALSLERLLRIVEDITDSGAPVGRAFELLGFLVPHYLELAIPAALFLAVMIATRRLAATDELAAMQAAGVPVWRLLRPLLGLAFALAAILFVNAGWVQPHARYAFKTGMHRLTESTVSLRLQAGVFQRLGRNVVVRADEVSQNGKRLTKFFAVVDKKNGTRTVITASRARVRPGETDGLAVELHDGTIVRDGTGVEPGSITFDTYLWEPPTDVVAPYGPRGESEQELTLPELMAGDAVQRARATSPAAVAADRHLRFLRPLSVPVLAVLAIPLGLFGSGRMGHAYGIVIGVAMLVLYQKLVGFAEAFVEAGRVPAALGLWTPFAGLLLLTALLVWHRAEGAARDLRVWLRRALPPGRTHPRPGPAE